MITNIPNSNNASYAYGVWVYVNNLNTNSNCIFNRESLKLYLDTTTPTLYLDMKVNDGKNTIQTSVITNSFPIQRWCYIIVSVDGQYIDYYLNGKLIKSEKKSFLPVLPSNIKINPQSGIYLGNSGVAPSVPFDAYISTFTRFIQPVDPQTAWSYYLNGNGLSNYSGYNVDVTVSQNHLNPTTYSIW
jgi:hypothetical protein